MTQINIKIPELHNCFIDEKNQFSIIKNITISFNHVYSVPHMIFFS